MVEDVGGVSDVLADGDGNDCIRKLENRALMTHGLLSLEEEEVKARICLRKSSLPTEHKEFGSNCVDGIEELMTDVEQQKYIYQSCQRNISFRTSIRIKSRRFMLKLTKKNNSNDNRSKNNLGREGSISSSSSSSSPPSSRRNSHYLDTDLKIKYLTMYIAHVNEHGLEAEGLYRKNGNENQFKNLLERVISNEGDDCDEIFSEVNIHTATKFMKWLLKQSCDLLLTPEMEKNFSTLLQQNPDGSTAPEILEELKSCLSTLPKTNVYFLITFLKHLKKVARHCGDNKMDSKNLATIFTPELLSCSMDVYTDTAPIQTWHKVTQVLIDKHEYLFDLDKADVNDNFTDVQSL